MSPKNYKYKAFISYPHQANNERPARVRCAIYFLGYKMRS